MHVAQHHRQSRMSIISRLWTVVMAGSLLGQILGAAEGRSNIVEDLVTGYLRDEGQVDIEGRTIVYKATVRGFSLPAVFDATARDTGTGITASAKNFDDPQDAYHKAVANLIAILRQRGLMKDQRQKTEPGSVPPIVEPNPAPNPAPDPEPSPAKPPPKALPEREDSPEPDSEIQTEPAEKTSASSSDVNHGQSTKPDSDPESTRNEIEESNLNPEQNPGPGSKEDSKMDRAPGEDNVSDEEKQRPLPDHRSGKGSEKDLQQEKGKLNQMDKLIETGWAGWFFHLVCAVVTAVVLMFFKNPLLTIGAFGAIAVGTSGLLGMDVFNSCVMAIVALVIIKIIHSNFQSVEPRVTVFVVKLVKSLHNLLAGIQPAGLVLDVIPDYQGSYAAYKLKPARPTADMLALRSNYKLWSHCKGLAYVLNNVRFATGERIGSDIDKENMVHLFEELGYRIILHSDLNGMDILTSFREFASMFNQEDARYDSAVVVLMSHGDTGVILGTDLVQVKLRDLQKELEREKCPGLESKPKMYFVQACRGNLSPAQPVVSDGPSHSWDHHGSRRLRRRELLQVEPDNYFAKNLPDMADVHFAFATTEGHLSLRSEVIGSFFVQALCEVFFAHAHQDNLDMLMNKVTERVHRMRGKLYDNASGQWIIVNQTPECVKRMRKALYFLPKYSKNP